MGVGYCASALHLIAYIAADETTATTEPPPGIPKLPGARYLRWPVPLRHTPPVEIVAWRARIAAKYRPQLGELLTWPEDSEFSASEDAATSCDLMLRYVAAIAEAGGSKALRALAGVHEPDPVEIRGALAEAQRRGFAGRFPQLLLGCSFWLPFQRNMIIEEPDWNGNQQRFGSAYSLEPELRELRALITEADPSATAWTALRDVPDQVLWAAWQASDTIMGIGAAAISRHLPLWTTD